MLLRLRSIVTSVLALASSPALADEVVRLEHGGRERVAWVYVPAARADPATKLPVVLALHGGGGSAEPFREYAGLDPVADREGFLAVYPEGVSRRGLFSGRFHVWNAGGCCGYAKDEGVDDVGFLLALLDELARRHPIDPARVYATGHSNGGMMAYRLAAEASSRVAAIAPVGGAMLLDAFAPEHPVAVLHVHSVDDPRALYGGGQGPPFPMTRRRVTHAPVEEQLARWAERDGCRTEAVVLETRSAPAGREDEGHSAELRSFAPCASGFDVALWRLAGPGHAWPGPASLDFRGGRMWRRVVGQPSAVIDAAEEAWRFFRRFRREAPAS